MRQDQAGISQLCKSLELAQRNKSKSDGKKAYRCKKSSFDVAGSNNISVDSWRFNDWDYKRDDLPTYARGLFTAKRSDGIAEIVIRGYDKFFNVGEVRSTEWRTIESNTTGPYELSVKENGCIIFMSGLEDGTLLVCSKHSTGVRSDVEESHAMVGEKWVKRHVESVGKTTTDLAKVLRNHNITAVGELCDDEFEEHVLDYPPEMAGIYLHGMNYNLPEFVTWSGSEVHDFADTWGFKKAQYVTISDLNEVKTFLDQCAETGSWEGRDTEGFVVRCKLKGDGTQPQPDWFFKYKFDEPYLMYRQWREATKAVIAGKAPRFKKHQKITEEYLTFARRRLAQNPGLGKAYNKNHGIIKMRDDFLAEKGKKGSEIIAQERTQQDGEPDIANTAPVVLVPIATIGCGKTTVATALVELFNFGHIQNDNIEGQKGRPQRFVIGVTNAISTHRIVIADRNNHQRRERRQLIDDVRKVVPDARFVALHYVHEPKNRMLDEIRRVTRRRVLERGDNHQTIRAGSKSETEIIGIMEGFLHRFQGCDTKSDPDNDFDEVIDLDVCASSFDNLETIVHRLYDAYPGLLSREMPTDQDMQDAIDVAMKGVVTTKHDLSFNKSDQSKKNNQHPNLDKSGDKAKHEAVLSPAYLMKQIEYFGISVSNTNITSLLSSMFDKASPEEAKMYQLLKKNRRIQNEFHVTLIHRASASQNSEVWQIYNEALSQAFSQVGNNNEKARLTPSLGPARLKLETLVWDDRIMTFVVRIYPSESGNSWPSANKITHITIGTSNQNIKPKESNDLLTRWESGEDNGIKIWEKPVTEMRVLEGNVKPFYQRGTIPSD